MTTSEITQEVKVENTLSVEELRARINLLGTTETGEPLNSAMSDLKKALIENPAAAALILPEDVGELVKALKRKTMKDIIEVSEKKNSKNGKTKMPDIEEIKAIGDEDW